MLTSPCRYSYLNEESTNLLLTYKHFLENLAKAMTTTVLRQKPAEEATPAWTTHKNENRSLPLAHKARERDRLTKPKSEQSEQKSCTGNEHEKWELTLRTGSREPKSLSTPLAARAHMRRTKIAPRMEILAAEKIGAERTAEQRQNEYRTKAKKTAAEARALSRAEKNEPCSALQKSENEFKLGSESTDRDRH
jgi:hypothetical protein